MTKNVQIGARRQMSLALIAAFGTLSLGAHAEGAHTRHVHAEIQGGEAQMVGNPSPSQVMNLDIVLPVRDREGLQALAAAVTDPDSPQYRHYITPAEFTARFGPTQADYDAVRQYMEERGLKVTGGSRDGMDLQVRGSLEKVEKAFHVTMRNYRHPTENRTFFSPDREPTTDLAVKLWHVSGLDNFSIPKPKYVKRSDYAAAHGISEQAVVSHATTGSGPSASFLGSDMRAAYYGSGTLTGAGQHVALFEYYGTDLADLATYYKNIGQTNKVPVTLISTDGTSTSCLARNNCDDGEQELDITQALGMAPGLAGLEMYVGSTDTAIISAMTTHSPLASAIGCSWGWTPADAARSTRTSRRWPCRARASSSRRVTTRRGRSPARPNRGRPTTPTSSPSAAPTSSRPRLAARGSRRPRGSTAAAASRPTRSGSRPGRRPPA